MNKLALLLLKRSRKVDALVSLKIKEYLEILRKQTGDADTDYNLSRINSTCDYDVFARVHYLESILHKNTLPFPDFSEEPDILMCSKDREEYRQACLDIQADQHFSVNKMKQQ